MLTINLHERKVGPLFLSSGKQSRSDGTYKLARESPFALTSLIMPKNGFKRRFEETEPVCPFGTFPPGMNERTPEVIFNVRLRAQEGIRSRVQRTWRGDRNHKTRLL